MNRKELKQLLKPIVQECVNESIKEIVLESGLLSQVISEVVKGVSPLITEERVETKQEVPAPSRFAEVLHKSEKSKISETRKNLLDSIGKTSYNGVNVFEGVDGSIPDDSTIQDSVNPMSGIAASDPGVDISQLFDFNKAKILANGKKRQR